MKHFCSRLALAIGALFSLVLGLAVPAGAATTTPVFSIQGSPAIFFGTVVSWGQGFTPTTNITVASIALLQYYPATPAKVAMDILDGSGEVVATGSGQTIEDGLYQGRTFSRLNLDAPVTLAANNNYELRIVGLENAGFIGTANSYSGGTMFSYDSNEFSYSGYDIIFRMYAEPAGPLVVAPTISVPGDRTVEANTTGGATTTLAVAASEGSAPITPSCTPSLSSVFPLGTTTVSCMATGSTGLTATGSFKVAVVDTTAPALVAHDVTAEATSSGGAIVGYTVMASDIADASPTVACNRLSGSTFAVGTTTVTCTATDDSSNTATGSFNVTVADTTAPVLAALADKSVDATSTAGASVTFSATANDVVDAAVAVTCSPASGSTFAVGTTTVTCTATDHTGNTSAAKTFQVTVRGATEQLQVLGTAVVGVGSGNSLTAKVQEIQALVAAGDRAGARSAIKAFTNQVKAQSGKKISTAEAAELIATAERISSVLA